jgi:integrase
MSKSSYPTGVENHGGFLRIWFIYEGKRVRESLGIPDTPKNRKAAGELRTSVVYRIKTGTFAYAEQFPGSKRYEVERNHKIITIKEMCERYLELKAPTISPITLKNFRARLKTVYLLLGSDKPISTIRQEDVLKVRNELLNGTQFIRMFQDVPKNGRAVSTVNSSIFQLKSVLAFAVTNGYIDINPADGIPPMRKGRNDPDPLSKDEFRRIIEAANHEQIKNFWSVAVYTGMRHGELCALAWEDIDLVNGTITVSRNLTALGHFCKPKTASGERVIHLIEPAIQALKSQMAVTRMKRPVKVDVAGREYGRSDREEVTFVFSSEVTDVSGNGGGHYSVMSVNGMWKGIVKRSGVRHRRPYQTRHTYACWSLTAGANPSFIASQMGHSNAQMLYTVYGKWMSDNNSEQVSLLNSKLNAFAPSVPHIKEA